MTSPAGPFSSAQEAVLRGSAPLQAAFAPAPVRVFTEVPQNQPPPYLVVGEDEIDDLSDGCGEAHSIVSTVQWWASSKDSARAIGAGVIATLNLELAIEGHVTVLVEMEQAESYLTDPDGSTRGRVAFRYETTALD